MAVIASSGDKAQELFKLLRERLEIPEHVRDLTLHMHMNEIVTIECTYYPQFKDTDPHK